MKTKTKRLFLIYMVFPPFFILLLFTGCKQGHKIEGATAEFPFGKVEIQGLSGGACGAPGYIAKEKGFLQQKE